MNDLLPTIRSKLDPSCTVRGQLKKGGCAILMAGAPAPRVVVDFDKQGSPLGPNDARCDYLLVAEIQQNIALVAPIEMKNGRLYASKVVRQLQAGADCAASLVPQQIACRFRPIAASRAESKAERRKLSQKENKIAFRGKRKIVQLLRCGSSFVQVL